MKFYLLGGSIVLVAVLGFGAMVLAPESDVPANSDTIEERTEDGRLRMGGGVLGPAPEGATIIRRLAGGYEPKEVTIMEGETIAFINDSDEFHWPASDVHPTHTIYSAFDPREPLAPGETWSFTFTEAGIWGLHDHLRANYKGTITVEPVH